MTIVAAVENSSYISLAADRMISEGSRSRPMHVSESKIFTNGDYTFGSAGRLRVNQILRHTPFSPPPASDDDADLWRFLSTTFAGEIQEAMREHGIETTRDNERLMTESELIVCVQGRVYAMGEDYSFTRAVPTHEGSDVGVIAIGSGADFAYGAAFNSSPKPVKMVEAAIWFDPYCGGGIDTLTL